MFVRKTTCSRTKRIEELWLRIRKENVWKNGQNATKLTSTLADTSIRFFKPVTTIFVEILCAFLFFCGHFSHSVLLSFLSQRCDHVFNQCGWFLEWNVGKECQPMWWKFLLWLPGVLSRPHWFGVRRVQNGANKTRKRPRNAGLDPISMKTNQWYSEPNGEGNDSQISSLNHMNEDSFGIKGSPYQNSKAGCKRQRKICKKERWKTTTITEKNRQSKDSGRTCVDGVLFEHGQDTSSYFWGSLCTTMAQLQSVYFPAVSKEIRWKRGTVPHVNVPVQHSLQHCGWVNSENHRIWEILWANMKGTMSPICHFFASFGELTMHMWFWQLRPTVYQQMQDNCWKIMAWWDASQPGAIICQFMQELTQQVMFGSCGNRILERTKVHMLRSLR